MAAFEVEPTGEEHRVLASAAVGTGYQMTCSCGWLSELCTSGLDLFDQWAEHVIDSDTAA